MVGTIIAGALSAATSIFGGISKSRAAKRQREAEEAELARQRSENLNWYNRNRYEDPLQNAYYQAATNSTRQAFMDSLKSLAGRNAVMGGSNASVAAAKEKASNAMAQQNAAIAARGAARQQQVEDAYLRNDRSIGEAQRSADRYYGEAQQSAITDAVTGLGNVAASAIGTLAKNGSSSAAATAANQVGLSDVEKNVQAIGKYQADVAGKNITENIQNNIAYNGGNTPTPDELKQKLLSPKWGF